MSWANILGYIEGMTSRDIFSILVDLNEQVNAWASATNISAIVYFIVGIALACVIGLFGYKLIKLFMALGLGGVGYAVGVEIFLAFHSYYTNVPVWCAYIVGGLIAIGFAVLAYYRFSYVLYTVSALCGYLIVSFYIDNLWLAIGGAILLGMLSVLVLRVFFAATTSLAAGVLAGNCLIQMLPADLSILRGEIGQWTPLAIMLAFAICFFIIQLATNRRADA